MKNNLYESEWIKVDGNKIHVTAIIYPNVKMGKGNVIGPHTVIGSPGEIRGKNHDDFKGTVDIGDNNIISEHVTIQRPFDAGKSTIIGDNNIIMAHSHVGHDVFIGDNVEICTGTVIGGYAIIYSYSKIKMNCTIRNRIIVGSYAVVGMGSVVTKHVSNYAVVYGNPAKEKVEEKVKESNVFKILMWTILFFGAVCLVIFFNK